jgi:cysteine synthase A
MIARSITGLVGDTPMIRLNRASDATGCEILGKCEFLNPGGSIKDRAALAIVEDAEARGLLRPGGVVVEGTAGNTGIGLAMVGRAKGYRTVIVMPRTQSREKKDAIRLAGAELHEVDAVPYKDPGNYVRVSERLAAELAEREPQGAIWANQFDNVANRDGHYLKLGPEIWRDTDGRLDAFTCAVGTGGTIAGVGRALRERDPRVKIVLADPYGSALWHWYAHGELKAEGGSITEGIGQGRITANLAGFTPDDQLRVSDEEALAVLFELVTREGLVLGGSAGINVAAATRVARDLGPGHTVVTILCDHGARYQSKLYEPEFLRAKSLPTPPWLDAA